MDIFSADYPTSPIPSDRAPMPAPKAPFGAFHRCEGKFSEFLLDFEREHGHKRKLPPTQGPGFGLRPHEHTLQGFGLMIMKAIADLGGSFQITYGQTSHIGGDLAYENSKISALVVHGFVVVKNQTSRGRNLVITGAGYKALAEALVRQGNQQQGQHQ